MQSSKIGWARKNPEGARPAYATIDGFDLDLVPRNIVDVLQQDWSNRFAKLADAILQRLVPRLLWSLCAASRSERCLGRQDRGTL